jgi:hypothetical protein
MDMGVYQLKTKFEENKSKKTKKNRRLRAFRQSQDRLSPRCTKVPEVI